MQFNYKKKKKEDSIKIKVKFIGAVARCLIRNLFYFFLYYSLIIT